MSSFQDATACDKEIREYREHQQELAGQLEDRQLNVQQLQSNADTLDGDIERMYDTKQKVSPTPSPTPVQQNANVSDNSLPASKLTF